MKNNIKRTNKTSSQAPQSSKRVWVMVFLMVFTLILCIQFTSGASDLLANLTYYYSLNETSSPLIDSVGSDNGTVYGGVATGATGILNNSIDFDADSTKNATLGEIRNLSHYTNFSINVWVKPEAWGGADDVFLSTAIGSNEGIMMALDDGLTTIDYFLSPTNYRIMTAGSIMQVGDWNMITVTRAGDNMTIYQNGTSVHSSLFAGGGSYGQQFGDISLGTNPDSAEDEFDGFVDEIGVWNATLTPAQVTTLWNVGSGLAYPFAEGITTSLTLPVDDLITANNSINFTVSAASIGIDMVNTTLYIWEDDSTVFNITTNDLTGNGITNDTSFNVSGFEVKGYIWNSYSCGTDGASALVCEFASANRTFDYGASINSQTYSSFIIEGSSDTFTLNLTVADGERIETGYLNYNGTKYTATVETDGDTIITKTITVPSITVANNHSFFWTLDFDTGFEINTSTLNQDVGILGIDNCTTYTDKLFNFTMFDEKTQAQMDGPNENVTVKVELILSNPADGTNLLNYSDSFQWMNPNLICSQSDFGGAEYVLDGVIEYSSRNRFTEFYHFQDYNLTNSTDNLNINLYNLNLSQGTEFKIIYKDSNFVPIVGAIIEIQRKYVDEGLFKTVELPKTGTEGYTIGHLVRNDVIYNLIVKKDGEILATFRDVVADCQNPTLSSCEINLNSYSSSNLPTDFSTHKDMSFTITWNKTSRVITSLFTVLTGVPSVIDLNVTLFDSLGNNSVCSDSLTSAGGTLSCTVPLSFGNTTVVALLSKDGEPVGQAVIRLTQDPADLYGNSIIFIALLVFLVFAGIGASSDNPMVMGIILAICSIVMIALNIIYSPSFIGYGATVLWFIVAIVLVLIKGGGRQ